MTADYTERYPGLYATPELVGRENILRQCKRVLEDSAPNPKLVFLHGLGGIGKTRLLRKILEIARTLPNHRAAEDVLDFYDILLHTPVELVNAIFETLTPPFDCFQIYQPAAQTLTRARLSGNAVELEKLRQDALAKFEQDLMLLSKNKRVILALDTTERLVYGIPGWTDEIPLADSWIWLIDCLPTWQNVVIFVAGREEALPAIEKVKVGHPQLIEEIEVGPFEVEESIEYFDKVAQLAKENKDYHLAERLENMPEDFKRGAHAYSQGRPILLSLLVDYLGFPGEGDLPEMLRQAPLEKPSEEETRRYEAALFERLRDGELGETLIALGRVPKGADEKLLAALLGVSIPEIRKRLQEVQRLSVVKIRRKDNEQRFFLHDEVYALLQRHVYDGAFDAEKQTPAFEVIKKYYQEQRENSIQRLNMLYAPVEEYGRTDLDLKELGKAHADHQALLTETMYYYIRQDLGRGFRAYSRYAQESILSRDVLMDLQLQAELLAFLSAPPAPILEKGISIEMILASLKIRPFARAWALGKYPEFENAEKFIGSVESDWRSRFPGLLAALHAWTASLRIMRGQKEDLVEAETHLVKVYSLLPEKDVVRPFADPSQPETLFWYEKVILALAHRVHGYLRRVQGLMKDAVAQYQKAATLLREIDLRIEMAAVSNDMGFAQAELGEYHDGRANVLHALKLRKDLGRRVPVALSLNTLAAIDVREGRYREARQNSERALSIFRVFVPPRGIGLALITLAEATRRYAGTEPLLALDERIDLLRRARDHAREAQSLFTGTGESSRLVEASIEIGCACRDLVWWLTMSTWPGDDIERTFKESWDALTQAAKLAQENGLTYRYMDALVNRAWLEYYRLESEEKALDSLYVRIDETEKIFPTDNEMDKQPQVWAQKGKLYVLKGHLVRRLLEQQRKIEPKGISDKIEFALKEIAENYAHGLEFSGKFSFDYQGIRQAKDSVSEKLKDLNASEMRIVCNQVKSLYPEGSVIQTFLTNRALWQE